MDIAKKQIPMVVYIDSNRVYFYSDSLGNVLQLEIPSEIITDLEIHNKDKFLQLFSIFIQKNIKGLGVNKFNVILVFSPNMTFEKDIAPQLDKDVETQEQEFIGLVPFENVLSRSYKINKGTRTIVLNNEYFELLNNIFQKNKLTIVMVLPYSLLQVVHPEFAGQLDLSQILQKSDSFKQFNMVEGKQEIHEETAENKKEKKPINKRLIALIGTFGVLLLVLFVFAYMTFFQGNPADENELIQAFTPTPKIETEVVPLPTESADLSTESGSLQDST